MNKTTALARLADAAPVRDDELAHETLTPEARALLERIVATPVAGAPTHRRARSRRLRVAIPALSAAVAAAIAVSVVLSSGGGGAESAAAATLRKAAGVARAQAPLVPGPGQYLYTKSVDAFMVTTVPAGGAGAAYDVLVPHVRETWLGPDGGRLYETSGAPQFLTPRDRARWIADGRPQLTEPASETNLGPAKALGLPSDPEALYAVLREATRGHGGSLYGEMFTLIGDSLRETSATPAQRAALYQVAARIPGVRLLGTATDSAGRSGIAVARDADGVRSTLLFDPSTSALLSEETVALAGNSGGYPAGMRLGYATYLMQAIVGSKTATP